MVIQIFCLPYIFISKNLYRFELIYLISFFLVPLLVVLFTHKLFEKNNTSTKNITVELFQMNFAATNSNINLQEIELDSNDFDEFDQYDNEDDFDN